MKNKCMAIAENGRINLVISRKEKGYKAFAKILDKIEKRGIMSFYGDVTNEKVQERSGLIITND